MVDNNDVLDLDLNIICTGGTDSVGILIEGYDNTVTNVRIGNAFVGVLVKSAGNVMRNIHPLYTSDYTDYANSCGFWDQCGNNWFDYCYSDQYGIAFRSSDAELCAQMEGAVAALVENGTYAQIAEKYPDIVNNLLFLNK